MREDLARNDLIVHLCVVVHEESSYLWKPVVQTYQEQVVLWLNSRSTSGLNGMMVESGYRKRVSLLRFPLVHSFSVLTD